MEADTAAAGAQGACLEAHGSGMEGQLHCVCVYGVGKSGAGGGMDG